jgi:cell division protein FtsL
VNARNAESVSSTPAHLRLVEPLSAGTRVRRRVTMVAVVVCVVTIVFGVLLERVILAQSAFKLAQFRDQLVAAEERHEELLLEASRLASPDRIEHYARSALGMVDASIVEYIVADVPTVDGFPGLRLGSRDVGGEADQPVGASAEGLEEAAP